MRRFNFEPQKYKHELDSIIQELLNLKLVTDKNIDKILKKYPKDKSEIFSRDQLISGIDLLLETNAELQTYNVKQLNELRNRIKLKPMRSESGVTTVTVLTKPFACPGLCVFCPNDVRMPKSYIATEPGAQRALQNKFSPYNQVYNRLKALKNIGHPTDKIELLVLGGTWVYYPKQYQVWFIKECFRAMNEFADNREQSATIMNADQSTNVVDIDKDLEVDLNDALREKVGDKPYNQLLQTKEFKEAFKDKVVVEEYKATINEEWAELENQQNMNSLGKCRCVGMVLETRPDTINEKSVYDLRRLGATKIQIGIQTLNDEISLANKRGETKADTAQAFRLLRAGGFKIHGHMMPNLYMATPEIDVQVYEELFGSEEFKPDELKIYPTSLIKHTELDKYWREGKYEPYSTETLINLIADCMERTPEYCRLTRIIRDIPSTEIEAGNTTTNLREIVEHRLKKDNRKNGNIRAREIGIKKVTFDELSLDIIEYRTVETTEYFLQYITKDREIAGFLRLSIPDNKTNPITDELNEAGIIREVHVYGPSLELSKGSIGEAQHLGLGSKLIDKAKEITKEKNFNKLAVISSIGTREYYKKRGFELGKLYQTGEIS